jgi:hypothetical protein
MSDQPQHFYQAIAILSGQLKLDGTHPILTIGDWDYPAYASKVVRRKHQPGQVQNFRVYPCVRHKQLAFQLVNVVDSPPTAITLNGCWELHKDVPHFIIYRNGELSPGDRFVRNIVPVFWENAPPAEGQFWQAVAEMQDGAIVVTKAQGPFDPPPKGRLYIPESASGEPRQALPKPILKPKGSESESQSPAIPAPTIAKVQAVQMIASAEAVPAPVSTKPLTAQEIHAMATSAKISLTCKLNQVPAHRELADKRIEFFLKDGDSDRIFTVQMKPKVFKKLTDHGFADWVAAITGEIGPATETGFELANAAVQVFEKKLKAEVDAVAKATVEQKPDAQSVCVALAQPPKSAGEAVAKGKAEVEPKGVIAQTEKGGKKKGLLDGVRLK